MNSVIISASLKAFKMFRPWEAIGENNAVIAENHAPIVEEIIVEPEITDDEHPEPRECHHRHLSTDAKEIIKSVHETLLEKNCSAPIKVTSELTKVPYSTVQLILSSENMERKKRDVQKFTRISETLGTEIKQVIYNMYKDNQVPTIVSLKSKLISLGFDINYCNESFRLYLRSIGFLYKTQFDHGYLDNTPILPWQV